LTLVAKEEGKNNVKLAEVALVFDTPTALSVFQSRVDKF